MIRSDALLAIGLALVLIGLVWGPAVLMVVGLVLCVLAVVRWR